MFAVTGATGLVGSHLLFLICSKGFRAKALYHSPEKIKHVKILFELLDHQNAEILWQQIEWIKADVRDYMDLTEAFAGVNAVFHTAALVSFRKADKQSMKQINWKGTNNVVNACLDAKVEYLSFVSSVAALDGVTMDNEITEALSNIKLTEKLYYGQTKFDAEKEVFRGVAEGLMASIVNPAIILGFCAADQSSASLFHAVRKAMPFYSKGSTGFIDVRDVVQIMWQLYENKISGQRYIVSSENMSYKELLSRMALGLGKKAPQISIPLIWAKLGAAALELLFPKSAYISPTSIQSAYTNTCYSNRKIAESLHYKFIPLAKSIEYTAQMFNQYYQQNKK
jgi:nucleoside-diphosphate-sugar epimerase